MRHFEFWTCGLSHPHLHTCRNRQTPTRLGTAPGGSPLQHVNASATRRAQSALKYSSNAHPAERGTRLLLKDLTQQVPDAVWLRRPLRTLLLHYEILSYLSTQAACNLLVLWKYFQNHCALTDSARKLDPSVHRTSAKTNAGWSAASPHGYGTLSGKLHGDSDVLSVQAQMQHFLVLPVP